MPVTVGSALVAVVKMQREVQEQSEPADKEVVMGALGVAGSGAGLGGSIFVNTSGSAVNALEFRGGILSTTSGSSVTGGAAVDGTVSAGAAASADIHVMGVTSSAGLLFNPILSSDTITISNAIGDDSSNTLPGPGYVAGTGVGSTITKAGAGTLILNGNNTYGGAAGTTIQAGTLQIASDASLGKNTIPLAFTGAGTIRAGGTVTSSRPVTIGSGITATFDTNGFAFSTSGIISGATGTLTKISAGTLTLSGANTYGGGTTMSAGTININADTALGTAGTNLNVTGSSTLQLAASISAMARAMPISAGQTLTIDTNSFNLANSGVISGATGALTKISAGDSHFVRSEHLRRRGQR